MSCTLVSHEGPWRVVYGPWEEDGITWVNVVCESCKTIAKTNVVEAVVKKD